MLDRAIEQSWSIVKESYPNAVVFQESDGLYFVRGADTAVLAKEFGIESSSRWYAFADAQAIAYMQALAERGYAVARTTSSGVALVKLRGDQRCEIIKQRTKGRFRALSPTLLVEAREIEYETGDAWMKRHGYEALFEQFQTWFKNQDWRSFRSYGEVYVYQVGDWYEVDEELSSMLESHILLAAKAALATDSKLPCKVVEPRSRRNRDGGTTRVPSAAQPLVRLGQARFEDW
ncbi:MAG: hypothetical protein WEB04_01980 [Dehalococcoidia bacterium]